MSILSVPNTFSPNTTISSSQINANFSTLYNDYNGSISAANLASNAVTTAKIADSNVTTAKLAAGAVTAAKIATDVLETIYPVGSIYTNATDSTNPGTLLGFGTWTAFGAGKVPVGIDSGDTDFDTAEETGGEKEHTLTIAEMPSHNHNLPNGMNGGSASNPGSFHSSQYTNASSGVTASSTGTGTRGSGDPHNNLQPYIVVHMWKRTA